MVSHGYRMALSFSFLSLKGLTADAADPDLVAFEHALDTDRVIDRVIDPMIDRVIDRVIDRLIEHHRLPYGETKLCLH